MFRTIFGHHQVYYLCLVAELVFLILIHILNVTIKCGIMLGNKTLVII
jgi:hypothetical protein